MCAWHRRGRLEHCRCRLKLTPRTLVDLAKKPLQEHSRSFKASGARPAGPLTRPHGIALATRREERPISKRQHLRDPNGYTHKCSGATIGDSHKGPLNYQGNPPKTHKKNAKREPAHEPKNARAKKITPLVAPAARQSGTAERPLGPGPPRSGLNAPSGQVHLARGLTPPSGEVRLARGPLHTRHTRSCSRT
jgi:cell wall-associated NlpC family hydrolase